MEAEHHPHPECPVPDSGYATCESSLPENSTVSGAPQTFPKSARLRHRSLVEGVFKNGKSLYAYPVRMAVRFMSKEELAANFKDCIPDRIGPFQILITIPKKKRKHAVDRVLLRRRIREAIRLNSRSLREAVRESENIRTVSAAFVYIADKNESYARIEKAVRRLIEGIGTMINASLEGPGHSRCLPKDDTGECV